MLIPLLFMTEVVGRLFREFAITLAVSILISPVRDAHADDARLLRAESEQHHGRFHQITGGLIDRVIAAYDRMLQVVAAPAADAAGGPGDLRAHRAAVHRDPQGLPAAGHGPDPGHHQAPQSISFTAMAERQQAASKALKDPDVAAVSSFIGVDGSNATLSAGRMLIALSPHAERSGDLRAVMARLQDSLATQDGLTVTCNRCRT